MRIEHHPKLNIWVREDGCIYLPQSGMNPAHWTFGSKNNQGYLRVTVNRKSYKVHRLVAETFIPNPENLPEVDHINRDPTLNSKDNLRWTSRSGNNRNTRANDRVDARGGTHRYEDEKKYWREYYLTHYQSIKKRRDSYYKIHKNVRFSDGKKRWIPNEQAIELLKIPVKERIYDSF